jgi:alpha-galactosidase
MYVDSLKKHAVLFNYNLNTRYNEDMQRVKLQGLNANKQYVIKEINLMPAAKSSSPHDNKVYSGDYLMKVGMNLTPGKLLPLTSSVFEITEQ